MDTTETSISNLKSAVLLVKEIYGKEGAALAIESILRNAGFQARVM